MRSEGGMDERERVDEGELEHEQEVLKRERFELLRQVEAWLELPMLILGFAWLVLLVVELIWGLSPLMETAVNVIWIIFILEFALRLTLAPEKVNFVVGNWLGVISLILPALRVLRIAYFVRLLRVARVTRSLRLVRVVGSLNRGMRTLGRNLGRRGATYVGLLTLIVLVVGAAGMFAFEREVAHPAGLASYGTAVWWTAMLMTTIGSEYWPQTAEGRFLALLISIYSIGIFGYITASIASFFIDQDAESGEAEVASERSIERLRAEIVALRAEIRTLGGGEREE
jgi:voltage-gated potassium channel